MLRWAKRNKKKYLVTKKKHDVFRALFRHMNALTASITLLVKDKAARRCCSGPTSSAEPTSIAVSFRVDVVLCFGTTSRRIAEPAPCAVTMGYKEPKPGDFPKNNKWCVICMSYAGHWITVWQAEDGGE